MNLRDYWIQSAAQQAQVREQANQAEREAYAVAHELLIHDGKLIKPEEYPCKCDLQSPYDCWQDKHPDAPGLDPLEEEEEEEEGRVCTCPCHTYWLPF